MGIYLNIFASNYNTPLACLITVGSVAELSNRSCELGSDISENGEYSVASEIICMVTD